MSLPTYGAQDDKRAAELAHVSSFALLFMCFGVGKSFLFLMMHIQQMTQHSRSLAQGII